MSMTTSTPTTNRRPVVAACGLIAAMLAIAGLASSCGAAKGIAGDKMGEVPTTPGEAASSAKSTSEEKATSTASKEAPSTKPSDSDTPVHPEMWMFDNKPITATKPAKGKKSFKITEHIYGRVFYDRPIKEVFSLTPEQYGLKVYQKLTDSGSVYDQVDIWVFKGDFDNKWLDVEILPDPAKAHTKYGEYGRAFHYTWANAADGNDPIKGKHKVYYEILAGGGSFGPGDQKDKDKRSAVIEIDFTGFGPLNSICWTTSFFLHRDFRIPSCSSRQPTPGVGASPISRTDESEFHCFEPEA